MEQRMDFRQRVVLGSTGLQVSRIGFGSSYGIGAEALERAYEEHGINYFYWGTMRREVFGEGIRRLARRRRDDVVIVVQSYARFGALLTRSVERALQRLQLGSADILLLGLHNRPPSARVMDAALRLRDKGRTRFLAVSCHRRATFRRYAADGVFDVLMFRYNAAHRGAEQEVLPHLAGSDRPGTVAYTATRWGSLLSADKLPPGEAVPRASDCYRFVLSRPEIDICLAGPANDGQMQEAVAALERGPMNADELAWMRRIGDHLHRRR